MEFYLFIQFMRFSRQVYWGDLPVPSLGDLDSQGSNLCLLCLLHWQASSLPLEPPRKSQLYGIKSIKITETGQQGNISSGQNSWQQTRFFWILCFTWSIVTLRREEAVCSDGPWVTSPVTSRLPWDADSSESSVLDQPLPVWSLSEDQGSWALRLRDADRRPERHTTHL